MTDKEINYLTREASSMSSQNNHMPDIPGRIARMWSIKFLGGGNHERYGPLWVLTVEPKESYRFFINEQDAINAKMLHNFS